MALYVASAVVAYLFGAIPFSYIAGKILTGKDIRNQGSRNAGASNAARVLGTKAGLAVLLLDFAKGFLTVMFLPVIMGHLPFPQAADTSEGMIKVFVFAAAVAGHIFPVYINFRGGKGVAVAAGCVTALYPPAFAVCLVTFAALFFATRTASAASLSAVWVLPLFYPAAAHFSGPFFWPYEILFISCAILITFMHRKNIIRLLNRTENRFSF